MQHLHPRGFSLIELMLAVAVLAILFLVAIPGFMHARAATASHTFRQSLLGILMQSRAIASTREQVVILCPSADQRRCSDTDEWHHGFLAAVDLDGNGRIDEGEPPVGSRSRFDPDVQVVTTRGRRLLKFHPNGGNAGSNATFTLCDRRGPAKATAIAMSNVGNYRVVPPEPAAVARACRGFD